VKANKCVPAFREIHVKCNAHTAFHRLISHWRWRLRRNTFDGLANMAGFHINWGNYNSNWLPELGSNQCVRFPAHMSLSCGLVSKHCSVLNWSKPSKSIVVKNRNYGRKKFLPKLWIMHKKLFSSFRAGLGIILFHCCVVSRILIICPPGELSGLMHFEFRTAHSVNRRGSNQ